MKKHREDEGKTPSNSAKFPSNIEQLSGGEKSSCIRVRTVHNTTKGKGCDGRGSLSLRTIKTSKQTAGEWFIYKHEFLFLAYGLWRKNERERSMGL